MTDFFPGLAGVPATRSTISFVDGENGILEYRGIRIENLAKESTFLETAYLLLYGKLPTTEELARFEADVGQHRKIKYRIIDLMKCLPESGHPMDALQAAVAALGMFYPAKNVQDPQVQYDSTVRLIAKIPTLIAAFARMRYGDEQISPRNDLGHAANFLYMLTGREPDPLMAQILDTSMILHAEHTMNASTFSGLVVASTLADPYTVVASALGTLTGPLHGGADEEVIRMIQRIGSVENVRPFIERMISSKEKIWGMGHRIYKTKDPRARILQYLAKRLFERFGTSSWYDIALEIEKVAGEYLSPKGVYPNVDFYSGILYHKLGIEPDCFTTMFAMSRAAGWLAHWLEQMKDNRLFRPDQIYEGEHGREYVPMRNRT